MLIQERAGAEFAYILINILTFLPCLSPLTLCSPPLELTELHAYTYTSSCRDTPNVHRPPFAPALRFFLKASRHEGEGTINSWGGITTFKRAGGDDERSTTCDGGPLLQMRAAPRRRQ
jgi:hypothetical protein